jgi:hypothetical protein
MVINSYETKLSDDTIIWRMTFDNRMRLKVSSWLRENMSKELDRNKQFNWQYSAGHDYDTVLFTRKEDAMLFILTWSDRNDCPTI